jgi:CubicO group peptidase (beta-lactamase class C family)
MTGDLGALLEPVFARTASVGHVPGIAWGLVRDGGLAVSGGLGTLGVGADAAPDADSVFRIASMTKSFTGAVVMLLRDEGLLRLDEPAATYVPELAGWRLPTIDSPPITVRHLLSMESGLPNDDPWTDRYLDLPPDRFDAILAEGASLVWSPGTRFEYASFGWGVLGRVVHRVTGATVQELVTERFLQPMGMTSTTWTRPLGAGVAEGARWDEETWRPEIEPPGDGAIAPMGGLWSTVRDLATWVAFFLDAFPPRDDPDDGPLCRASRREMQQLRRTDAIKELRPRHDGPSRVMALGYGAGLFVRLDPRLGVTVAHSGGLPGYGSHMRWLPDRGIGLIAFGNVTYAPMGEALGEAFEVLADADLLPTEHRIGPAQATREAAEQISVLLRAWDDDRARSLFADNVALDVPFERRRREAEELHARHGELTFDGTMESETPHRATFKVADGKVSVDLDLSAHVPPRVLWLEVTDRTRPLEGQVITDPDHLRRVAGGTYVMLRPAGDLAERFVKLQGALIDRFPEVRWAPPGAHLTLTAFDAARDEADLVDLVRGWALEHLPLALTAEAVDVFEAGDHGRIPYLRIAATRVLRSALAELRRRAAATGLLPGSSDVIPVEEWIFHLSLGYGSDIDDALWAEVVAWVGRQEIGGVECATDRVEVRSYDGGTERLVGRFPLGPG